ncbi:hypothetical protein M413DRAFT_21550 [Hebeloma cylindrosporum]|uniref:Cytochrome b561 domain-containing protein n=1 Tax=Hebeloma cylindrosporum TaxID=76867 RepID=A0A0C2Z828_HEBCY|nr:hypothetical protein M413DRAFT_21550 [Hebeloma cylindrosporum h7]
MEMGLAEGPNSERRSADTVARQIALTATTTITAVTWTMVLANAPFEVGWFALHPPLQTLALSLFTFGIITLQPTSFADPRGKTAGLLRHQAVIFFLGFPSVLLGTFSVSYNKWLLGADHFTTWHGFIGIFCMVWFLFQVTLGAGSVWAEGLLFGGGLKAKALWKYHRLSGYLLFPALMFTLHLGGARSNWSSKYSVWIIRFMAFTVGPVAVVIGVFSRMRTSKMHFLK